MSIRNQCQGCLTCLRSSVKNRELKRHPAGLRSLARNVEQFPNQQTNGGATAPSDTRRTPRT